MLLKSSICVPVALMLLQTASVHAVAQGLKLIPTPREVVRLSGSIALTDNMSIAYKSAELSPLATVLASELNKTGELRARVTADAKNGARITLELSPNLKSEGYQIRVDSAVHISGGSYAGVAYGTVTFLQAVQVIRGKASCPRFTATDEPAYRYRGALLDLGRKYHTPAGIEQVIELCRIYKIRYLHLHLTDDQLFMFPSTHFPALGKSNREFARFEPGSAPKIGPYTVEELRGLERFARDRAVCLVPEIDLPGHSGRLIADASSVFGIPANGSTVNIASPKTLDALTVLLNEVMDIFKSSPYVHLGADEVGLGGLDQTQDYQKLVADGTVKSVHDLYCRFVMQMHDVVVRRGKIPIVWEEACNAEGPFPLPKDTLVMIWSQGRSPADVVRQGYRIINATWTPLYIVRDNKRSPEFLFAWSPPLFGREGSDSYTRLDSTDRLDGAQLCSWEDSEAIEIQSLRERLAIVAERLWSAGSTGSFADFQSRFKHTDALVDLLVHPISLVSEAQFKENENSFNTPLKITLKAVKPDARLTVRYALDNSLPGPLWHEYKGQFTIEKTVHLRAGLFDSAGKQQGYLVGAWYKNAIPVKPNFATNRPVTVGPSPDRTDAWAARVAVDGQSDDANKHWASVGEAPQWLMVDLQKVTTINFINVITYWDGSRYYQWNAEVSENGSEWHKVLDFSQNTAPASAQGYSGRFTPVKARCVRINMLKNSANPYVHIVELIVDMVH